MKSALSLRTAQRLALSPQLQQAMHLLQLPAADLLHEITQELTQNPFLQIVESDLASGLDKGDEATGSEAVDLLNVPLPWGLEHTSSAAPAHPAWEQEQAPQTLQQHLLDQLPGLPLCAEVASAAKFLIASLNEEGFLEESLAQLASFLLRDDEDLHEMHALVCCLEQAMLALQELEPTGVGARNLTECLQLQLERQRQRQLMAHVGQMDPALDAALTLCRLPGFLPLLADGKLTELARQTMIEVSLLQEAVRFIEQLEPRPARAFGDLRPHIVIPDVLVRMHRGSEGAVWTVSLNPQVSPRLQVNAQYVSALKSASKSQDSGEFRQQVQKAQDFVQGLNQRFETVLQVCRLIVQHQQDFLLDGEQAMQALTQRELARILNVHESTVWRATHGKYMATPRGTFELKYFFGNRLRDHDARPVSDKIVRARIRRWIAAENPLQPLSDQALSEKLADEGIVCARRTVAKYRQRLQIPSSRQRRKPFES